MPSAKALSVEEFETLRKKGGLVIVDVRDAERWNDGHIQGAIHIHKDSFASQAESILKDKNAVIVCYCGGGKSGPAAAEYLADHGYTNAAYLVGGYRSYTAKKV